VGGLSRPPPVGRDDEREAAVKLTLDIFDDGHAILSTPDSLTEEQAANVKEAYRVWRETPEGILVLGNGEVRRQTIQLDLKEKK